MTSVAVNGAQGKMGCISCEAIDAAPNLELVATLGRHDNRKNTRTTSARRGSGIHSSRMCLRKHLMHH